MPRTPIAFRTCFYEFARGVGYTAAQVEAAGAEDRKQRLLDVFSRSYQIGYDLKGGGWEDARTGATIEPADGVIAWDVISDAEEFDVWEDDPRDVDGSQRLKFDTDADGVRLIGDFDEVWVRWIPRVVDFSTTAWVTSTAYAVGDVVMSEEAGVTLGSCYRCLTAHTSGTFATDLAAANWILVPVLTILKEFVIAYSIATYKMEDQGQPKTGVDLQEIALSRLDTLAVREQQRNNRGGAAQSGASTGAVTPTSKYVRFDTDQSLSTLQQLQALENQGITIDAGGLMTLPGGYTIYLNAA